MLRVETSENAAGTTGFDEVAVTLEKREIPGTGDRAESKTCDLTPSVRRRSTAARWVYIV